MPMAAGSYRVIGNVHRIEFVGDKRIVIHSKSLGDEIKKKSSPIVCTSIDMDDDVDAWEQKNGGYYFREPVNIRVLGTKIKVVKLIT